MTDGRGSRVGREPIERVVVMENHDAAYRAWRDAGVKDGVLVHLDAHHDMFWIPETAPITIANFICPTLREGLVRELFWVVPDRTWDSSRGRRAVLDNVRTLARGYPGGPQPVAVGRDRISTRVLGRPLTACSLRSLPRIDEAVLLDIDVDYLVTPCVPYGERGWHGPLPWCWPGDLVARLGERELRSDLVTIAYSVEGGYTPLQWKYLGDELALRLTRPHDGGAQIQGMELIREAVLAAHRGDRVEAQGKYRAASALLRATTVADWHLAHLYVEMGRTREARELYRRALATDPSYRTAYNTAGLWCQWDGRFREAERQHRRALALDPRDPYAAYGMGVVAAHRKQWNAAKTWLHTSLSLNPRLVDAHAALGDVLAAQERRADAIAAYEASLRLTLAGHRPLGGFITTSPAGRPPIDGNHWRVHARLARLYELEGATARAIDGYRIAVAGGAVGALLRARLARLLLKRRRWREAAREAWRSLQLVPESLTRLGRRFRRRPSG